MMRHGLDRWIRPVTGGPLLLVVILGIYSVAILAGVFLAMRPPRLPDARGTRQAVVTNGPEGEAGPSPVQGTIAVDPSSIWTWKFFLLCGIGTWRRRVVDLGGSGRNVYRRTPCGGHCGSG